MERAMENGYLNQESNMEEKDNGEFPYQNPLNLLNEVIQVHYQLQILYMKRDLVSKDKDTTTKACVKMQMSNFKKVWAKVKEKMDENENPDYTLKNACEYGRVVIAYFQRFADYVPEVEELTKLM